MSESVYAYAGATELLALGSASFGAYRPTIWSTEAQLTYVRDYEGTLWFFDAVMRIEHQRSVRITEHPVQNGANLSDHSFQMPAHLSLEIGMSDSMASYEPGQYDGGSSRSVGAWKQFVAMLNKRMPMTVTTRLDTYVNMVMEQLTAPDDFETRHGLTAFITFKEIITAVVASTTVSVRPQTSQQNNMGPVQPTPPQGSAAQAILKAAGIEK